MNSVNTFWLSVHLFPRDIHGYVLWYRKGYFAKPTPQAKPRSLSLDVHKLSLDLPAPPLPLRPRYNAYVDHTRHISQMSLFRSR